MGTSKKQNMVQIEEKFKNITLENIAFNYDGKKLLDKIKDQDFKSRGKNWN